MRNFATYLNGLSVFTTCSRVLVPRPEEKLKCLIEETAQVTAAFIRLITVITENAELLRAHHLLAI